MLNLFFILCYAVLCRSQEGPPGPPEPKYVIIFDSPVYVYAGDDYIDTSGVMVGNYNESVAYMYGVIKFLQDIDNVILEVILQKEASGKWEVMVSHDICEFCAELGDESPYKKYLKYFGFPTTCPFVADEYHIHNLVLDMEDFGISDQHMGKYLAILNMFRSTGGDCKNDRELLFTTKIDLIIERE